MAIHQSLQLLTFGQEDLKHVEHTATLTQMR